MPSTMIDSSIFKDAFGTAKMRDVFCDDALVRHYLDIEIALAKAEARVGLIPPEAAEKIAAAGATARIDVDRLKSETDIVGYPIVGIVHQLSELCGDAGGYVHWGATTQDIMDTATVLQVRAALEIVEADLNALQQTLVSLSKRHKTTVMAGRTHLQHALPITFGYKTATWLSMIDRHRDRLTELRPRVLVGQLAGAAGTLASLGHDGLAVHDALMAELGLSPAPISWHVARDGLAETVGFLGLVTGSLAKIATDVMLMMQTEIGEVFEPFVKGRGSSSTMPQKRNPISCELIVALAKIVRQQSGLMLDAMLADHERATGPWHLEWAAVPEAFIATAGALGQARFMLDGLIVEPEAMRRNLNSTRGLIVAEAVMMELARHTGRQRAHDVIYGACRAALHNDSDLLTELMAVDEVTRHLDEPRLRALTDPANYVGAAPDMIDRVLGGR